MNSSAFLARYLAYGFTSRLGMTQLVVIPSESGVAARRGIPVSLALRPSKPKQGNMELQNGVFPEAITLGKPRFYWLGVRVMASLPALE